MASTTSGGTRTITLRNGEKFILPPGAVVKSIVLDGSINITSSCPGLPTPTEYGCGYFYLILDSDNETLGGAHSMDEGNTFYVSLTVGATVFEIGQRVIVSGENPGTPLNAQQFNNSITDQSLFKATAVSHHELSNRQELWLYFKAPSDLMSSIELAVNNFDSIQYYKPNVGVCGEYPFGSIVS